MPSEPDAPGPRYEQLEVRDRVRAAIASLPRRERKVIGLYYYGEVTMKQIGQEIGVNESRVSQLHARAIRRLREALGRRWRRRRPRRSLEVHDAAVPAEAGDDEGRAPRRPAQRERPAGRSVIPYASTSRAARSKSPSRNGFASQGQPLSSRKRSASVPTTSPVTKISRRGQRRRRRGDAR